MKEAFIVRRYSATNYGQTRVEVLSVPIRGYMRVRLPEGVAGWVEAKKVYRTREEARTVAKERNKIAKNKEA